MAFIGRKNNLVRGFFLETFYEGFLGKLMGAGLKPPPTPKKRF
jgi:hypothetical protein